MADDPNYSPPHREVLDSWKEIAAFFQRGVTTVQRWEREEGLPVHRHGHGRQASVYALRSELEAWRDGRDVTRVPQAPAQQPRSWTARFVAAVALASVALAIIAYVTSRRVIAYSSAPLTSFPDRESWPALSPDGAELAFSWNGNTPGAIDIYVRRSSGDVEQLTHTEEAETSAAWSPDGKSLAFLRSNGNGWDVVIRKLADGSERTIDRIPPLFPLQNEMQSVAWTADSSRVLFSEPVAGVLRIVSVDLQTGDRQAVTAPPSALVGDLQPAVEPRSGRIAFVRYSTGSEADVYLADGPGTTPQRLTDDATFVRGIAWISEDELVVSSARVGGYALWRLTARDGRLTPLTQTAPANAVTPSTSLAGRIAYVHELRDVNLWSASLGGGVVEPIAHSTWTETSPEFSPDGQKLAFSSTRSGFREIWVSKADGSSPVQLTELRVSHTESARWSPDGKRIVFVSQKDGNRDIYVISTAKGEPVRLTTEPSEEGRPSWSRDGRTLYFRSDRSGSREIWAMPSGGGAARQITRDGGYEAHESFDGRSLLYVKERSHPGLWSVPVGGGAGVFVANGVREGHWSVGRAGVYFLDASTNSVHLLRPPLWRVTDSFRLGEGPRAFWSGLTVRPDGGAVVWCQQDLNTADILMLDRAR